MLYTNPKYTVHLKTTCCFPNSSRILILHLKKLTKQSPSIAIHKNKNSPCANPNVYNSPFQKISTLNSENICFNTKPTSFKLAARKKIHAISTNVKVIITLKSLCANVFVSICNNLMTDSLTGASTSPKI